MIKSITLSALALCVLLPAPSAWAGELTRMACVKTEDTHGQLNIRSAANISAPVVSRVRNGQCGITIIGYCGRAEKAGDWCTIQFGQIRFGIVAARYLRFKAAE